MSPILIVPAAIFLLVLVIRLRGLLSRQPLNPRRLRMRIIMPAVIGTAVAVFTASGPLSLLGDAAGLVVGAAAGWLGLRLTVFDHSGTETYFTPNPYLSLGVMAVFLLRFALRMSAVFPVLNAAVTQAGPGGEAGPLSVARQLSSVSQFGADPLMGGAFFVTIGYYICYSAALLRARQRVAVPAH